MVSVTVVIAEESGDSLMLRISSCFDAPWDSPFPIAFHQLYGLSTELNILELM
jgi:hypothetical protein